MPCVSLLNVETTCCLPRRNLLRLAVPGHEAKHRRSRDQPIRSLKGSRRQCVTLQARPASWPVRLLSGHLPGASGICRRPGARCLAGRLHPTFGVRSAGAAQPPRELPARGERRFHGQSGHFPAAIVGHHLPAALRDWNSSPRAGSSLLPEVWGRADFRGSPAWPRFISR